MTAARAGARSPDGTGGCAAERPRHAATAYPRPGERRSGARPLRPDGKPPAAPPVGARKMPTRRTFRPIRQPTGRNAPEIRPVGQRRSADKPPSDGCRTDRRAQRSDAERAAARNGATCRRRPQTDNGGTRTERMRNRLPRSEAQRRRTRLRQPRHSAARQPAHRPNDRAADRNSPSSVALLRQRKTGALRENTHDRGVATEGPANEKRDAPRKERPAAVARARSIRPSCGNICRNDSSRLSHRPSSGRCP